MYFLCFFSRGISLFQRLAILLSIKRNNVLRNRIIIIALTLLIKSEHWDWVMCLKTAVMVLAYGLMKCFVASLAALSLYNAMAGLSLESHTSPTQPSPRPSAGKTISELNYKLIT